MSNAGKKIIVSVTNDLTTDQRVAKICDTLLELDYEVILVGRRLKTSQAINRKYDTKRFKLWFNSGALFYANYNIHLFFYLLFSKFDALWSNDLDTLLSNYLVSRLKGEKIIFDSHEYFTEVPELVNRPRVKKIWKLIERQIVPKLKHIFTVSPSIAKLYNEEYGVNVKILRNLPQLSDDIALKKDLKVEDKNILVYQGAVNINRGIEYMVKAMKYIDNAVLYILGVGDIYEDIHDLISKLELNDKVKMLGEIPLENLKSYTVQADIGLSLEENAGLNYRYALPNKLFNYIHANIPVLVSDLPEMKAVVNKYNIGEVIENHDEKHIADKINSMLNDKEKMQFWKANTKKAMAELNWEKEKQIIKTVL